jgi:hypothetical protein
MGDFINTRLCRRSLFAEKRFIYAGNGNRVEME